MTAAVKVRSAGRRLAGHGELHRPRYQGGVILDGQYARVSWQDWIVDTSDGCACEIGGFTGHAPTRVYADLGHALDFAREHAETHTCPSWRASGERCDEHCADCGGAGWIHPNRYDADAAFMLAELGLAVA